MVNDTKSQLGFAHKGMPWLVGAVALGFYLVTLVRWPTVAGLAQLSQIADWDWRLIYHAPLHFLLTYPVQWLPPSWQLAGLNSLAALWSAMTLGLLARCVVLLPHDRTKQQRQLERSDYSMLSIPSAWLPPLLAVLLCGLQLSFWENAIVETGEALDLLLFAAVVWCLLEYRVDEKDWRLVLGGFLYGLGITNNYAMIPFFPLFLTATVWIKGLPVFKARFLLKFLGAIVAGLLLYLLLPALNAGSELSNLNFWQTLMVNFGFQKDQLAGFPRYVLLITGLTSLVPILFIGIRWPATFGDVSPTGAKLTELMTQVIHGMFLLACIYVAFDPPFSPRQLGAGRALLPLYFLGALSAGYFAGYFLLMCSAKPGRSWERPSLVVQIFNRAFMVAIWVALVAVPAGLIVRNHPLLKSSNGRELEVFGRGAAESLPDGPAYILADDTLRLHAFQAMLNKTRPRNDFILVDTSNLSFAGYHRFQRRNHPQDWPDTHAGLKLNQTLNDPTQLQFVIELAKRHPLFYLHPSFGFYFEHFYASPHKLVYALHTLPANTIRRPLLSGDELQVTDDFLSRYFTEEMKPLVDAEKESAAAPRKNRLAVYSARIHSMIMNCFGVELQMAGNLDKAANYFQRAVELNSENPLALINLDFNRYLKDPVGAIPKPSDTVTNLLASYGGNWNRLLGANGPVDEPNSCYFLARAFFQGNNPLQAAQQLYRSLDLQPDFLPAKLLLCNALVKLKRHGEAGALVEKIRQETDPGLMSTNVLLTLMETEAWAKAGAGNLDQAVAILRSGQQQFARENAPFIALANLYLSLNQTTNAVRVYEDQLKAQPNNLEAMVNLSAILINNGDYPGAIQLLNRVLEKNPKNLGALMNRAIAHLNLEMLTAARNDYLTLQSITPNPIATVEYGLGEIAWRERNLDLALGYFESFLKLAAPGSPEIPLIQERVNTIKAGSR